MFEIDRLTEMVSSGAMRGATELPKLGRRPSRRSVLALELFRADGLFVQHGPADVVDTHREDTSLAHLDRGEGQKTTITNLLCSITVYGRIFYWLHVQ